MSEEKEKNGNQSEKKDRGQFPTLSRIDSVEEIGTQIGPYKLLSVLGEGGFGVVYRAEQKEPVRRQVALKVIKPGMDSKQVIARFEAERQALALLDHPNIAHIYDGGTTESGHPYFVMELVRGLPITEYCDEHTLSIEDRLNLFSQVCEAVQYAHQKGVIHRDIKPSNILVRDIKPPISDHKEKEDKPKPVPMIIDFGIAKATQPLTEKTLHTEVGQFIGTLEYMSPEQAKNSIEGIDTRTDIYSLGVVLYELLTGTLPFTKEELEKAGRAEIHRIIREADPPRPSTRLSSLGEEAKKIAERRDTQVVALTKRLYKELEWIPLKAMRKEPDRRYKTASELADDVRNYLNGDPLMAGPESRTYRLKKTIKRHRVVVSATVVVLMTLAGGIVATTMFALKATDERDQKDIALQRALQAEKNAQEQAALAEEQRKMAVQAQNVAQEQQKLAEENAERTRRSLYVNRINLAQKYYYESNIRRVHELLKVCPEDLRGWEWYHLWRVSNQARVTLRGHEDLVTQVAFSPDGRRILSCDYNHKLKVWDAKSGTELMTLKRNDWLFGSVAFSRDCMRIFSCSRDKNLKIWDVNSGTEVMTLGQVKDWLPDSTTFSRDGRMIAADIHGILKVWDAKSGGEVMSIKATIHPSPVALSPDGRWIVSAGPYTTLKVWDAKSGIEVTTLKGLDGFVDSVTFSPYGRWIASGSGFGTLKVWDAKSGSEVMTIKGHDLAIRSLAFSPDGERIVSGSDDSTLKVWDVQNRREVMTLRGHEFPVSSVGFSPDGKQIVSGSMDKTLKVWDAEGSTGVMTLQGSWPVAFSPNGGRIVSGSDDSTLTVWDVHNRHEGMTLRGHEYRVSSVGFSPDGKQIVSGSADKTLKVWDSNSGAELRTLRGHNGVVSSVALSPDGKRIVSGSDDKTLKVWDANTGSELMTLTGHRYPVTSAAFSPDSRRIVSGSFDNTLIVWDADNGEKLMTLRGQPAGVYSVAFSPDGKRIVAGGGDSTLIVWDAEGGSEVMILRGHEGRIHSVAFSPDGKRIVSGSDDKTLKVWDADSGSELTTLRGHNNPVESVAFSPNGGRIVSGSFETVTVWSTASPKEVEAEQLAEERGVSYIRKDISE